MTANIYDLPPELLAMWEESMMTLPGGPVLFPSIQTVIVAGTGEDAGLTYAVPSEPVTPPSDPTTATRKRKRQPPRRLVVEEAQPDKNHRKQAQKKKTKRERREQKLDQRLARIEKQGEELKRLILSSRSKSL